MTRGGNWGRAMKNGRDVSLFPVTVMGEVMLDANTNGILYGRCSDRTGNPLSDRLCSQVFICRICTNKKLNVLLCVSPVDQSTPGIV